MTGGSVNDIEIPASAAEAVARAEWDAWRKINGIVDETPEWDDRDEEDKREAIKVAIVGLRAGLNAWKGADRVFLQPHRNAVSYSRPAFILPLAQEGSND